MPGAPLPRVVEAIRAAVDRDPDASPAILHQLVQGAIADDPACVLVADGNGQLVAASKKALATLGYTLEALRSLNVTDMGGESEDSVEWLWENFRRQRRQSGGFVLRRKDGTDIRTQYAALANAVAGLSIAVHVPLADAEGMAEGHKTPDPRVREP